MLRGLPSWAQLVLGSSEIGFGSSCFSQIHFELLAAHSRTRAPTRNFRRRKKSYLYEMHMHEWCDDNNLLFSSLKSCNPTEPKLKSETLSFIFYWAIVYRVKCNMFQFIKESRIEFQHFISQKQFQQLQNLHKVVHHIRNLQ